MHSAAAGVPSTADWTVSTSSWCESLLTTSVTTSNRSRLTSISSTDMPNALNTTPTTCHHISSYCTELSGADNLESLIWTMESLIWTIESLIWTMESLICTMESLIWTMESLIWTMESLIFLIISEKLALTGAHIRNMTLAFNSLQYIYERMTTI